jgi:hypothetical protein
MKCLNKELSSSWCKFLILDSFMLHLWFIPWPSTHKTANFHSVAPFPYVSPSPSHYESRYITITSRFVNNMFSQQSLFPLSFKLCVNSGKWSSWWLMIKNLLLHSLTNQSVLSQLNSEISHIFWTYCILWMVSSGLLRRVALVRTYVSEEPGASIRVTKIGELGTTQAATSNRRTLRRNTKWDRKLEWNSEMVGC